MRICPRCSNLYPNDATVCRTDGAELRSVLDPLIGKTVAGRYRLISRLGAGGMSTVYLARHVMIERLVAVKTLRRDLARDPVQRDRFIREARAVNRINHENIVDISDFGESEDGLVYLVMEYVPGESLLRALMEAPFPVSRAFHLIEQCAGALGRAHQMGVVHRDLKPENILLVHRRDCPDFVKVLDFGIAKILDAPSLTGSQQIFGTPGYIAPEYIQSSQIDGRADLYSLGVILYEMCTAALPFDYEYPGDLLVKHVTDPPIRPRERNPNIEPALETFILQCLEKDPEDRFRDAYHFLDELRKVRERLGSPESWGSMGVDTGSHASPAHDPASTPAIAVQAQDVLVRSTLQEGTPSPLHLSPFTKPTPLAVDREPRDPLSQTMQDAHPPRMDTAEYDRPTIPQPPSVDGVPIPIDVEISVGESEPSEHPSASPPAISHGLLGVERWRLRHDAIQAVLDDLDFRAPAPAEVAQRMAFASSALEALEEGIAAVEPRQREIEELQGRAADFRSTLGRAIDSLGRKLSKVRGEFETVATRRNALRAAREAAMVGVRAGRSGEGLADARLWELAAADEELRVRAGRCDALEAQLGDLRAELDRQSEGVEARVVELVQYADHEMDRLDSVAATLREPLEFAERYAHERWAAEEELVDPAD